MRLIDAHKLWDVMNKATLQHIVTNTLWNTLKSVVENAPTIDAVEVVRCKDCKHWASAEDYDCEIHSGAFGAEDFCSYGERKGGGDK